MVDHIHMTDERRKLELKLAKKNKIRELWNVCTRGYRMVTLGAMITEEGTVIQLTSDLDFVDMIISEFGAMLPLTRPHGLLLKFAEEREVIRLKMEKEKLLDEEARKEKYEQICLGKETSSSILDDARLILAIGLNGTSSGLVPFHRYYL